MKASLFVSEPKSTCIVMDGTDTDSTDHGVAEDVSEYRTMVQSLYFPPIPEVS